MDREHLLATLAELQDELRGIDSLGDETRAALARVADDVRRVLDPAEPTTDDDAAASRSGLQGVLLEFEAEHPKLAETIGRLADGLANLGI